ncbi:MAG: phosphonoacetaldehyde hydrolase, partial [Candidatus Eremiobacteraeota bacterium]|nr:phosphonoacetaldehyde hydrolase [Candidatus Eremiobacteraeota bacterium]
FASAGVPVSDAEIRRPMGLEKRRHLQEMLADPHIGRRWHATRGAAPSDGDIDLLHRAFDEHLNATVAGFARPVPGLRETVAALRAKGIAIGSNTGYSPRAMSILAPAAREFGFEPDCIVTPSDVAAGRPAPDLSWKCLDLLGLAHDTDAIKVDDTVSGIEEGRNAGLWTVAVAISGNEAALSYEQWQSLTSTERQGVRSRATAKLRAANPDYVIDSVAQLAETVDTIERRIASGERPPAR